MPDQAQTRAAHRHLQFALPRPGRRVVRDVALALFNHYLGVAQPMSRTRLLKVPRQRIRCWSMPSGGGEVKRWESSLIALTDIERELEHGDFDYKKFELPDPRCDWLDAQVTVSPAFHAVGSNGDSLKFALPTRLGSKFPIVPTLDREGTAISSPQLGIQARVLDLRTRLVETSDRFATDSWFQDMRSLVAECVSLVDITLHQLFYKAKYDPLPGWTFDEAKIGPPHARRLAEKLRWVHSITMRQLENTSDEYDSFIHIKDLRNHLQHFDPPCFCFTMEDVARWLNEVLLVARLTWRIRRAVGSSLSVPLIRILLAPEVQFVPQDPARPRLPQPANVGYASTRWP